MPLENFAELDNGPVQPQAISTALYPTPGSHCSALQVIPIACLPFDIMSKIFADTLHASQWNPSEVVALATACQDWYRVMLDAPYLWSHIDLDQSGFLQSFIQRSCDSLLHIFNNAPRPSTGSILSPLSLVYSPAYSEPIPPFKIIDLGPYTQRIQTSDLNLTSPSLQHLLKIIRLSPILPQLKQLRITHRYEHERDTQLHINAMAADMKIISPFLNTMILTDMMWHASSYTNLRTLSLDFNSDFTSSQVLDYVNSILTQSSRLQDLCVRFWDRDELQTSHLPTLHLPLLKTLVLSGHHLPMQLYEAIDAPISRLQMTAPELYMYADVIYSRIFTASRCQRCESGLLVFNESWEMLPVSCECLRASNLYGRDATISKLLHGIRYAAPSFFITQLVVCLQDDPNLEGTEQDRATLFEALPSLRKLDFDVNTSIHPPVGLLNHSRRAHLITYDGPGELDELTRAVVALFNRGTRLVPSLLHLALNYYFHPNTPTPHYVLDAGNDVDLYGVIEIVHAVNCFAVDWAGSTIHCKQLDFDKTKPECWLRVPRNKEGRANGGIHVVDPKYLESVGAIFFNQSDSAGISLIVLQGLYA
ncbi:hypothetical protein PHLCEN_2v2307 [Hermanssonia centrifuga]|uniref:Uncharacterized protein n=1 Tax=Hermanssonia centrifuga TaxID=98765 RepID=A0A2R6RPH7_9APHY|nr:hypothetical protein PHLCEN_2v2307 [Hermanssonia centrifuga]